MGALVTVCSAMPDAIRDVALPLVQRWVHVLPSWVGEIKLEWDEKDSECNARIWVAFEYRRVVLSICPHFMALSPERQSHTIVHEMCHAYTTPISSSAVESIRAIVGEESTPGSRVAEAYLNERVEGCTEDLTNLVERLVGNPDVDGVVIVNGNRFAGAGDDRVVISQGRPFVDDSRLGANGG